MKTLNLFITIVCLTMMNTSLVFSQGEGKLTKRNITHYGCEINSITVKWSFRSLMGEPVKSGSFKWEAGYETDDECLSYKDFIILKVQYNSNSNVYAWVEIDPTTPDAGEGYSYNTSGSPSWDDFLCSFGSNGQKTDCFSEEDAKRFWKGGFSVVDFKLRREE